MLTTTPIMRRQTNKATKMTTPPKISPQDLKIAANQKDCYQITLINWKMILNVMNNQMRFSIIWMSNLIEELICAHSMIRKLTIVISLTSQIELDGFFKKKPIRMNLYFLILSNNVPKVMMKCQKKRYLKDSNCINRNSTPLRS